MSHRPAESYVHGLDGPGVFVPGRIAAVLIRRAALNEVRLTLRGLDPEVDAVLEALVIAAVQWRQRRGMASDMGSDQGTRGVGSSRSALTTAEAADLLGITQRAVRLAIEERRLAGRLSGGVWLVDREDIEQFRARREPGGEKGVTR